MTKRTDALGVRHGAMLPIDNETRRLLRRMEDRWKRLDHDQNYCSRVFRRIGRYEDISFLSTNETIAHIVGGIAPTPQDTILAVCGSGDQAFALAEHGARIVAVDNNPAQIQYGKDRADLLRKAKYFEFLTMGTTIRNDNGWAITRRKNRDYLARMPRLRAMRENVENIEFHIGDIFDGKTYPAAEYTKIYLSNAHTYGGNSRGHRDIHTLVEALPRDGLLYVASPLYAFRACCGLETERSMMGTGRRTADDYWNPVVYRKVPKRRASSRNKAQDNKKQSL